MWKTRWYKVLQRTFPEPPRCKTEDATDPDWCGTNFRIRVITHIHHQVMSVYRCVQKKGHNIHMLYLYVYIYTYIIVCIYIYIYYTGTGFLPFRNRSSLGAPRTCRTPPGIRSGPSSWVRIKCSGHGNAGSLPATDGDSFLTWVLVQGHSWYHQRVLQMSLEGTKVRRKRTESLLVLHVGTCIVHYSIYVMSCDMQSKCKKTCFSQSWLLD